MGEMKQTFADMPPSVFDRGVAVDVGQQAEAESLGVVGRVCVSVDNHRRRGGMKHLTDTIVQLVICNRRPVALFLIRDRLYIYKCRQQLNEIRKS